MNKKQSYSMFVVISCCAIITNLGEAKGEQKALDNDPNLAGWWTFDETAGKTAADSSPHHRKGVLTGNLSFDENSVAIRNDMFTHLPPLSTNSIFSCLFKFFLKSIFPSGSLINKKFLFSYSVNFQALTSR